MRVTLLCRWIQLGDRLQLDYFKAKALAFMKAEFDSGRVELLLAVVCLQEGGSSLAAEIAAAVPASVEVVCERCTETIVLQRRCCGVGIHDPRARLYELFCNFCGQRFCLVPVPEG